MHWHATGRMIQAGVALVATMTDSARKEKCFAWLCGYASHVVADVTIHPVVRLMCKGDSKLHRKIETHQDSYIADLLNVGALEDTDLFVGLESCFPGLNPYAVPFKHYKVTIVRAGKAFSVLVCDEDGAHALLEDASCTVQLDRKPWQQSRSRHASRR